MNFRTSDSMLRDYYENFGVLVRRLDTSLDSIQIIRSTEIRVKVQRLD